MVTHNKLDGLGSNLVGVKFSVPIETWPGAHPPQSSVQVKEKVQLYRHFPSVPSWQVIGWNLCFIVQHLKTFPLSEQCTTNTR